MCYFNKSELPHPASGILQEKEGKNCFLVVGRCES